MPKIGAHAVVLGASMGGLLAARVLADFYETVTVVERDRLPDDAANRRGVPQGRHVHALLGRGSQVLAELFPGFLATSSQPGFLSWTTPTCPNCSVLLPAMRWCAVEGSETSRPPLSPAEPYWSVSFGDGCVK
jgi:hypothetical protein